MADLPSRGELLELFGAMERDILEWLRGQGDDGLTEDAPTWPWTDRTSLGQALYLLRHLQHHAGELRRRGSAAAGWE